MPNVKTIDFHTLCLIFRGFSSVCYPQIAKELDVSDRTVKNWITGVIEPPEWAYQKLLQRIEGRGRKVAWRDHIDWCDVGDICYVRIKAASTYIDLSRFFYLVASKFTEIQRIIFFKRKSAQHDGNEHQHQHQLAFLIELKDEGYLFSECMLTASRRPREMEVQEMFRFLFSLGLAQYDKASQLPNYVYYTKTVLDTSKEVPIKTIIDQLDKVELKQVTKDFIEDFIPIISWNEKNLPVCVDPSKYLIDHGKMAVITAINRAAEGHKTISEVDLAGYNEPEFNVQIKAGSHSEAVFEKIAEQFMQFEYTRESQGLFTQVYSHKSRSVEITISPDGTLVNIQSWVKDY